MSNEKEIIDLYNKNQLKKYNEESERIKNMKILLLIQKECKKDHSVNICNNIFRFNYKNWDSVEEYNCIFSELKNNFLIIKKEIYIKSEDVFKHNPLFQIILKDIYEIMKINTEFYDYISVIKQTQESISTGYKTKSKEFYISNIHNILLDIKNEVIYFETFDKNNLNIKKEGQQ